MTERPMDCPEIRDSLLAGSVPSGPGVEAHVRGCAACEELLSNGGALGRALSRGEMPAVSGDELFASVERAVLAESGPRAWLRSRPTPVRAFVAVLAVVAVVVIGGRSTVGGTAGANSLWLAAFGAVTAACLWMLVAPLGRPRAPMALRFGLVASALALPFGYAALASTQESPSTGAVELGFAEQAVACFSYGTFLALPFLAVVWAVERSDRPFLLLLLGFGAVAGVVANAALALHCPNTEPAHLALGHATVGVALALLGALWSLSTRGPSSRA